MNDSKVTRGKVLMQLCTFQNVWMLLAQRLLIFTQPSSIHRLRLFVLALIPQHKCQVADADQHISRLLPEDLCPVAYDPKVGCESYESSIVGNWPMRYELARLGR